MHDLYTNNINFSTAVLKNLLQTKHKHESVLCSIGFHTRKLNIQGREKKKSPKIFLDKDVTELQTDFHLGGLAM